VTAGETAARAEAVGPALGKAGKIAWGGRPTRWYRDETVAEELTGPWERGDSRLTACTDKQSYVGGVINMNIRRVLSTVAVVGLVGVIAPLAIAGPASAKTKGHTPKTPTCSAPKITKVSAVHADNPLTPVVTIRGKCFGTETFPANGLSSNFLIVDNIVAASQIGNTSWNACYAPNSGIACTISSWTNNKIVLTGFIPGYYGLHGTDYSLHAGDSLTFEVWADGSSATSAAVTVKAAPSGKKHGKGGKG